MPELHRKITYVFRKLSKTVDVLDAELLDITWIVKPVTAAILRCTTIYIYIYIYRLK